MVTLVFGTLGMMAVGRRIGVRQVTRDPEAKAGSGAIEGAVFGVLGLLIAFTFSHAAQRYDIRRDTLVDEANSIGTAWMNLDLLPAAAQPPLREKFRQYLDARLNVFNALAVRDEIGPELARANTLQSEIWTLSVAACRESGSQSTTLVLLPALSDMFSVATVRTMGAQMHNPWIVYLLMGVLVIAGSLLAGYNMGVGQIRSMVHSLAFVLTLSVAIYVILDYEFPRVGLIRLQYFDQVLIDLRQSMNP
jgi:hypothetical protein